MADVEYISLLDLQEMIAGVLEDGLAGPLWVRAEISELKQNVSGHCYLTLVEKEQSGGTLKARVTAIIWAQQYRIIRPFFESAAGRPLSVGMNILVKVKVQYSDLYGLSLIVCDIDPSFTVGELEAERQRTIERLEKEGMFEMNSSLELPLLPRRLAVVTSATAAGYRDFLKHLSENEYGFEFHTELFPAIMQGADSPSSVISALDAIAPRAGEFDAVLIMRGGGGAMDLICFDDYDLAVNVAQFPLPVLTGIGHDHDFHVVDMVAHTNVRTPTALADFLTGIVAGELAKVDALARSLQYALKGKFDREMSVLDRFSFRISSAVDRIFSDRMRHLDLLEARVSACDPQKLLARGYAVVLKNGRRMDKASGAEKGDRLRIMFEDGTLDVEVL